MSHDRSRRDPSRHGGDGGDAAAIAPGKITLAATQQVAGQGVAGPGASLPYVDAIARSFGPAHEATVRGIDAHVGGAAGDAARAIGAQAYATGRSVAFAGAPDLHTAAHEAAHVVQQRQGVHLKGGVGEAGDPYERHADAVADRVVGGLSAASLLGVDADPGAGAWAPALQRRDAADPPVVATVKAMIAEGRASPIQIAAYLRTAPSARPAALAYLHHAVGDGFVRSIEKVLAAPPEHVDGAVAAEVDGVPTGAVRHRDDDEDGVEMTVTEKKNKVSFAGGAGHLTHTATATTTEGEHKHVDERATDYAIGKSGVAVDHGHSVEDAHGEDAVTRITHGVGGGIGPAGVNAHGKLETEAKLGDRKHSKGFEGGATLGFDGKLEGEAGRTIKREGPDGSHESKLTGGLKDKKLELGVGKKDEHKTTAPDGTEVVTSRGLDAKVRLGLDGVGGDIASARTSASGVKTSASAGFDAGKEGVSAHAGYSVMNQGGSSVSMSASGGVKVYANAPVQVGDHFEVTYLRTTSAGGNVGVGSSLGGIGASLSGGANEARFESGIKSFKSKEEAAEFQKEAAERVTAAVFDPGTVQGAMMIPVGETRGHGRSSSLGASGGLSLEGASISGGVHESSGQEVNVRRVSAQLFDVTYTASGEQGAEIAVSGGITNTKSRSKSEVWSVTWRFDVFSREGRAAFEKYCRDRMPPAGHGTLISVERSRHADTKDHVKVAMLGDAEWKQSTDEKHRTDAAGRHDEYKGGQAHDQDPSWLARHLGDKALHSQAELSARMENGQEAGYTATVHVSGESGAYNREQLGKMSLDPVQHGPAKASGEWTLSADIDKKTIHQLEHDVSAFRGAHTQEEKMRVLTALMAQNTQMMRGKAGFDIELKGDKYFPGRAGRERTEATLDRLVHAITLHPATAAAVVTEAQVELDALADRRAHVADPAKYTDLPDGLRAQQLHQIDQAIAGFHGVRHRALQESVKHRPGEAIEAVRAREADPHAFAGLSPEEKQLARLRDQIADKDAQIAKLYQENGEASRAVDRALRSARPGPDFGAARDASRRADDKDTQQAAGNAAIEDVRIQLFTGTGARRIALAQQLLAMLETKRHLAEEMWKALFEAGIHLRAITTPGAMRGHEAFWAQFPGGDLGDA